MEKYTTDLSYGWAFQFTHDGADNSINNHHTEITLFILGSPGYIFVLELASCHFPGPSLAGQGGSVHSLVIFICHKNCPQTHSEPPRQAFLWLIPQFLCSSVPPCPHSHGIPGQMSILLGPGEGAQLVAFQVEQRSEALLSGMLWTPGALGLRPQSTWDPTPATLMHTKDSRVRIWEGSYAHVDACTTISTSQTWVLGKIITNEIVTVTAYQEAEYSEGWSGSQSAWLQIPALPFTVCPLSLCQGLWQGQKKIMQVHT